MKIKKSETQADGLQTENLRVVKNAGFKAAKRDKRDAGLNRRAGLHDKKKNMMGESRVLRRKPLELKHVRRMRKAAAALSAVFIAGISYAGYGFFKTTTPEDLTAHYETVCYELPTDGSSPDSHTAVEAVGYMNYVFKHQSSWYSKYNSTVHTTVDQNIETYKYYSDGVLVSADITTSSLINNARQFCVADGRVLWREASGGKSSYNGMETPWKDKLAGNLSIDEFKMKRGFPPTEFSVYVINEKTVLTEGTSETATDNGDGTYSVTLHLNHVSPVSGGEEAEAVNETSAIYYYQQQMKVTGGISGATFSDLNVKYTFDADYRVLRSEISESYVAEMGISASCKGDSVTEYFYDDTAAAADNVQKYYGGFFSRYTESAVEPDDRTVNTAECLAKAFGSVLTEGAVFKLDLQIDDLLAAGFISVDPELSDIRVKIGDIKAYYGGNELYIASGEGVKCKIDLNSMPSTVGLDTDALLAQLGENQPVISEDGTRAVLNTSLNIFGVDLNLEFVFVLDGNDILLGYVGAAVPVGESCVKARLTFGTAEDTPAALTEAEKDTYTDVLNDGLSLNGKMELNVGGTVLIMDIDRLGLSFNGGLALELVCKLYVGGGYGEDGTYSGGNCLDLYLSYADGTVTIVYGEGENAVGVKVKTSEFKDLKDALADVVARLADVVCEVVPGAKDVLTYDNLSKLLQNLEIFKTQTEGTSEIADIISGEINIPELLNNIGLNYADGKMCVTLGKNIALDIALKNQGVDAGVKMQLGNSAVALSLTDVAISGAFGGTDCPVDENSLLTSDDIADILDYLAAAAELIVEDEYSAQTTINLYEQSQNGYAETCEVGVSFEYVKGEQFPVLINLADSKNNVPLSITLANDMYFHLGISIDNKGFKEVIEGEETVKVAEDDLYLDFWILDANPTSTTRGISDTSVNYDKNDYDGLDVYVSVSKFKNAEDAAAKKAEYTGAGLTAGDTQFTYSPFKVYAPVDEILTILSAGVALLDLQRINISEQSEALDSAIKTVANVLDDVLIKKYLPATYGQFNSLGSSLIPQIIGKDLSTLLSEMLSALSVEEDDTPEEIKNGNFIKSIKVENTEGEGSLEVVINSGAGCDTTKFTATKGYSQSGKSYVKSIGVSNVYYGGDKKTDFNINIERAVQKAQSFTGFYNFSGVDNFLKAAVNSATHKTTEHDRQVAEKLNVPVTDYTLNHYYLVNGLIRVTILGIDIDIDTTLSVNIDEYTNAVTANIHLEYDGKFAYVTPAINGNTVLDMTIKDGMLYMKRVQTTQTKLTSNKAITPITIYRVMPLSEFAKAENLMDNIGFIFNFGDYINEKLQGIDMSGGNGADMSGDLGESIGQFLAYFTSTADKNSASWTLALSGKGLTKLVGMTMDDVVITFLAETKYDSLLNANTYLVTGLNLSAKMVLVENMVNLTLSGNLTYCNPQESLIKGYTDKATNVSVMWEELLGCSSASLAIAASDSAETGEEVLKAKEVWERALAELNTGKNYLEVNSSSSTGVNLGEISIYVDGEKIDGITVLYGANNGLLSVPPQAPEFEERVGYDMAVTYTGFAPEDDGTLSVTDFNEPSVSVNYSAKKFTVTLKSDFAQEFSDEVEYVYGTDLNLINYLDGREVEIDGVYYTIIGFELDGARYSGNVSEFNVLSDVTLTAVWGEADRTQEFTVTYLSGETVVTELTALYGSELDLSVIPDEVTGYEFIGWNYGGMENVYCNREVTAVFRPETYTVTLDLSGYDCAAEAVEAGFAENDGAYTISYVYDTDKVELNPLGEIPGFEFVNYYYRDENGQKTEISDIYNITSDLTVYPEFRDIRIHVTLSSDVAFTFNGQAATAVTGGYELLAHVVREDSANLAADGGEYSFLGWWYADENGSYCKLDDLLDIAYPGETVEFEIRALWGKAYFKKLSSDKSTSGSIFNRVTTYSFDCEVAYEFKGFTALTNITHSSIKFEWFKADLTTLNKNSIYSDEGYSDLSYSNSTTEGSWYWWEARVEIKFALPDGNEWTANLEQVGNKYS